MVSFTNVLQSNPSITLKWDNDILQDKTKEADFNSMA